jgi:hypothetical protein
MPNYRCFCISTPPSFTIFRLRFVIFELWSNETDKKSLNKVVQQGRIYIQLNFQNYWSNTCRIIDVFVSVLHLFLPFFD